MTNAGIGEIGATTVTVANFGLGLNVPTRLRVVIGCMGARWTSEMGTAYGDTESAGGVAMGGAGAMAVGDAGVRGAAASGDVEAMGPLRRDEELGMGDAESRGGMAGEAIGEADGPTTVGVVEAMGTMHGGAGGGGTVVGTSMSGIQVLGGEGRTMHCSGAMSWRIGNTRSSK